MERTDAALVRDFEALAVAPAEFGHREHVRLAFALLAETGDFAAAGLRFKRALIAFATSIGAAGKYHETLTWAYLTLIHARMASGTWSDSTAFLVANADVLDHRGGALARYYDVAAIAASPLARRVFVLPEPAR
jgi:hypothetical protein